MKSTNKYMFTLYKIDGNQKQLSQEEGKFFLAQNRHSWKNQKLKGATFYTENLETIFTGDSVMEAFSTKYNSFASSLLNNTASKLLGIDVYGECLVETTQI